VKPIEICRGASNSPTEKIGTCLQSTDPENLVKIGLEDSDISAPSDRFLFVRKGLKKKKKVTAAEHKHCWPTVWQANNSHCAVVFVCLVISAY